MRILSLIWERSETVAFMCSNNHSYQQKMSYLNKCHLKTIICLWPVIGCVNIVMMWVSLNVQFKVPLHSRDQNIRLHLEIKSKTICSPTCSPRAVSMFKFFTSTLLTYFWKCPSTQDPWVRARWTRACQVPPFVQRNDSGRDPTKNLLQNYVFYEQFSPKQGELLFSHNTEHAMGNSEVFFASLTWLN